MAFSSVEGLLQAAGQVPLWRAVLEDDLRERGVDEARSWRQMAALWTAMKAPVAEYDPAARSRSGLTGGAGATKLPSARNNPVSSTFLTAESFC